MDSAGDGRRRKKMNLPARMNSMTLVEQRLNSLSTDGSGRSLDYNLGLPFDESGSLKLSGRDLLDILTAFTSNSDAPLTPREEQLAAAQNQDKSNTQYLGDEKDVSGMKGDMVPPRANMFQRGDLNTSLGSSMKFQELGRCPPVGGAFNEVYAAGYDDLGYTVPSPIDPSSQATGHFQQALQAQVHDPMTFERILLSGKKTGLETKDDGAGATAVVGRRPTPPLKRNQARTGYKHKPKKAHPAVEKARRDGINALIEDLRDIVPEGGWTAHQVKRSTSLRDAMEGLQHGSSSGGAGAGAGEKQPDKRTKRAVLMDAIASIDALKEHVNALQEENEALASGKAPLSTTMANEAFLRAPSTDGKAFEEEEMKKVHVEIHLKQKQQSGAQKPVESPKTSSALIVKIAYFDRRGFLADECVALRSLDLNIKSAELPKPNRNGFVQDMFEVDIDKVFASEKESQEDLQGLQEQLTELLLETQSLYYQTVKAGEKRART